MRKNLVAGVAVSGLAVAALLVPFTAHAAAEPVVQMIGDPQFRGPGCPTGNATAFVDDAGRSMTILLDRYAVSIGPNVPRNNTRTSCVGSVGLRIPAGRQLAVSTVDTRGFVSLDVGVSARQQVSYRFVGGSDSAFAEASFAGPVDRDFLVNSQFPVLAFSRCGSNTILNINSSATLDTRDRTRKGLLGPGSFGDPFVMRLNFALVRCVG